MENITKSIVYGNNYENRYGRFLPVCSSIAERGTDGISQPPFSPSSITCMRLPISENTIASPTPFACRKAQWCS